MRKYLLLTDNLYPLYKKYPTAEITKILKFIFLIAFLILNLTLNSCKTCNCPAYSEKDLKTNDKSATSISPTRLSSKIT